MQYQTISGIEHYVFDNLEEFEHHFGEAIPEVLDVWYNAQEGDWVWSDDGRIVQILKRGTLKGPFGYRQYQHKNGYLRTVVGTFFADDSNFMDTDFSKHKSRYSFSGITSADSLTKRKELTAGERRWIATILAGRKPLEALYEVFNPKSEAYAKRRVDMLLQQERVMDEIRKQVAEACDDFKIDMKYIMEEHKKIVDNGDAGSKDKISSLRELTKIIGGYKEPEGKQRALNAIPGEYEVVDDNELEEATTRKELLPGKEVEANAKEGTRSESEEGGPAGSDGGQA